MKLKITEKLLYMCRIQQKKRTCYIFNSMQKYFFTCFIYNLLYQIDFYFHQFEFLFYQFYLHHEQIHFITVKFFCLLTIFIPT